MRSPHDSGSSRSLRVSAGTAKNPQRRTATAKHAPRARRTPFALLILGLLVGGMGLLLALNTASAANEVARHDLAAGDQSAAARLVELENEVQASAAPGNLAAAAAALGMVPAGNPGFLEIGTTGRVRVLGDAAPASAVPVVIWHPAPTKTAHTGKHANKDPKRTAKTAKPTKTARTAKKTGKTSAHQPGRTTTRRTGGTQRAGQHRRSAPRSTSTPTPTPTPTLTPETTLPGGNR